jgi:hypothetical protein
LAARVTWHPWLHVRYTANAQVKLNRCCSGAIDRTGHSPQLRHPERHSAQSCIVCIVPIILGHLRNGLNVQIQIWYALKLFELAKACL